MWYWWTLTCELTVGMNGGVVSFFFYDHDYLLRVPGLTLTVEEVILSAYTSRRTGGEGVGLQECDTYTSIRGDRRREGQTMGGIQSRVGRFIIFYETLDKRGAERKERGKIIM